MNVCSKKHKAYTNRMLLYRSLACSSAVATWCFLWVSFLSTWASFTMTCFRFRWISSNLALIGPLNTIPLILLTPHPMATCIHLALIRYVDYGFTWVCIYTQSKSIGMARIRELFALHQLLQDETSHHHWCYPCLYR